MEAPNKEQFEEQAIYNIGVVTRMTDIPVATLRAWERRYGFPNPDRTPGGHRLYSERDVANLKWIKAQIDAGMQTRQAVKALQHLEEEGHSPVKVTSLIPHESPRTTVEPSLSAFHQQLTTALLEDDREGADQVLGEVMALYPLEDLILQVVRPAMAMIGQAWRAGQITIADEHRATNYLRHRLVMWMGAGPPTHPVASTILACAPGEWHEGSLLMLGVLLRRRRWPVTYLGQSLPLSDLAEYVRTAQPPAVVLVAMVEETARELVEWPKWLPEAAEKGNPVIAYGGRIFTEKPEWRERVPGLFLGRTLGEGVETLDRILRERLLPGIVSA
ncbi:MAG: MerR family transcriptional regulator [Anaerolineae bacterium]